MFTHVFYFPQKKSERLKTFTKKMDFLFVITVILRSDKKPYKFSTFAFRLELTKFHKISCFYFYFTIFYLFIFL